MHSTYEAFQKLLAFDSRSHEIMADLEGRELRILFLKTILERLGFDVQIKGDLLDASITGIVSDILVERIESLGKFFGVTKQMDMHLKDHDMVVHQIKTFFQVQ